MTTDVLEDRISSALGGEVKTLHFGPTPTFKTVPAGRMFEASYPHSISENVIRVMGGVEKTEDGWKEIPFGMDADAPVPYLVALGVSDGPLPGFYHGANRFLPLQAILGFCDDIPGYEALVGNSQLIVHSSQLDKAVRFIKNRLRIS